MPEPTQDLPSTTMHLSQKSVVVIAVIVLLSTSLLTVSAFFVGKSAGLREFQKNMIIPTISITPIISQSYPTLTNEPTLPPNQNPAYNVQQNSKQPCSSDSECTMESACGMCWIRHINDPVTMYECYERDENACENMGVTPKCILGYCRAQ